MSGGGLSPDLWRRLAEAQDQAIAGRRPRWTVPPEPRRRRLLPVVAAALLAAGAATALLLAGREETALRFQVGAAAGAPGRPLVARADSELPLRFSDGSTVTFQPGVAGRLQRLSGSGAEVVLEAGALDAHVVHGAGTRWWCARARSGCG